MKPTIVEMLNNAATHHGTAPYTHEKTEAGWTGLSFAEVRLAVRSLAAALVERDLVGTVSIIAEGRNSWLITELTTLYLGQVSVPLSIKLQAEEIPYRINHAEVKLIVCSNLAMDKVLAVWNSFDHPVQILFLDNDAASLTKIADATGLKPGAGLFTFDTLLEEGRSLANNAAVQERVDAYEIGRAHV